MGEPSGDGDENDGASSQAAGRPRERPSPEEVIDRYDFEDFGPVEMAEMSAEEWEAVFDPASWITGQPLLDRVEADLKHRVRRGEVFAVVERIRDGGEDRLLAYSDVDYAIVYPDGSVEGEGTIRRDVEPVVVLCSMDDYEVPALPEGDLLPDPTAIEEGSGQLGNRLVQVIAVAQLVAGGFLLAAPLFVDLPGRGSTLLTTVAGLGFLLIGLFLLVMVANARLSDRFRAEEYRQRLRDAGVGSGDRPDFLPLGDDEADH
jgi:hypothetical protein